MIYLIAIFILIIVSTSIFIIKTSMWLIGFTMNYKQVINVSLPIHTSINEIMKLRDNFERYPISKDYHFLFSINDTDEYKIELLNGKQNIDLAKLKNYLK